MAHFRKSKNESKIGAQITYTYFVRGNELTSHTYT